MNLLRDLLYKTGIEEINGPTGITISAICFDSRKAEPRSLFVAVRGTQSDGHQFIDQVIDKGAAAIVCEEFPKQQSEKVTYIKVKDSAVALGFISSNFYDDPSQQLKLFGITGTNGKTTTATLLHRLFRHTGYSCGLLSTVENLVNDKVIAATHTTPDPVQLNELLREMVSEGCTHCFMEVSSHAVAQHRISGLHFEGGVFTNITRDHLDYHKTFDEYIKAKKGFFDLLSNTAFALVNIDDKNAGMMVQNTKANVKTFSLKSMSDFKARIMENNFSGLLLNIDGHDVSCKLIGSFNAYNLLAVYATAVLSGLDKLLVLTELSKLTPPEGRFEYIVSGNNVTGIVDYAHTPDALQNVLKTINDIRTRNEKVITVIGCGGDRDTGKRPQMASIACEYSDKVILTSDNPRSENPDTIIEQMKLGVPAQHFKKAMAITDRKEAVKVAVNLAEDGDIILLAGKGHEKYQEIKGVKYPFDDKQVLEEILAIHN